MKNKILMSITIAAALIGFFCAARIVMDKTAECIALFSAMAWINVFFGINIFGERFFYNVRR